MRHAEIPRQVGTEGLGLFDLPRARRSDPETSHQAAASMVDEAQRQKAELRAWLDRQGPNGAIANEADLAHDWDDGTAGRRFGELVREGAAVYLNGTLHAGRLLPTRKRKTSRGRWAFVLVALSHLDKARLAE